MKSKLKALSPDYNLRNIMSAFFGQDPDVTVVLNQKKKEFNIVVGGCDAKADSLRNVLKGEFKLYGETYKLLVNGKKKTCKVKVTAEMIKGAFTGNKIFGSLYIKMKKKRIDKWAMLFKVTAIQFPNDQGNSPYGFETHSAQDLARLALTGKIDCAMLIASQSTVGENGYWDMR